jgi:hypothetical protein
LWATGEQLVGRIINDAASAASNWLVVDRTGTTVDNVTFPGTATTVSGTLSAGATDVTTLTASGNAAINTTLPTINTVDGALLVGSQGSIMCFSNEVDVGHNFYYNSGWKYRTTDTASQLTMGNSGVPFLFQYTASGTADTAITWSEAGRIDASGNWNFQAKSLTTTGTLSAGATDVTTLTASGDVDLTSSSSGTDKELLVQNTSNTASSAAHLRLDVAGASAADPYIHWSINGVANIYAGIDNSDGDNFKIGESFTTPYVSFTPSTGNATFAGTADITNGVYIGGSAAANLLDDYEEGTWTPTS